MEKIKDLKESAPFTASDIQQTVNELRRYRSLMWNMSQNDGRTDYAIQYYEVVRAFIYGLYFTWEKYKYENGWIDGIADEGESLLEYQLFQIGIVSRIEGLRNALIQQNIFEIFSGGQDTRDRIILIFNNLLSNIKEGTIELDKHNLQSI